MKDETVINNYMAVMRAIKTMLIEKREFLYAFESGLEEASLTNVFISISENFLCQPPYSLNISVCSMSLFFQCSHSLESFAFLMSLFFQFLRSFDVFVLFF